jgi:putative protease
MEAAAAGIVELAFAREAIDTHKIRPGQRIWKTHDPQLERRLRKSFGGRGRRSVPLDMDVEAVVGMPLRIAATAATGASSRVESPQPLVEAVKHAITVEMLEQQLARLGHTVYRLRHLNARIVGRPMVPLSVLGTLRRELIAQLQAAAARPPQRAMAAEAVLPRLRAQVCDSATSAKSTNQAEGMVVASRPQLHVLCYSMEALAAAVQGGASSVIVDFRTLSDCGQAVRTARRHAVAILLATPRIHRPGENSVLERLAAFEPDGLLVRNLAGLAFCRARGLPAVADFSLNAANPLSVAWLRAAGARRVTASYDLNRQQVLELAMAVPPEWLEVVIYRHTPLFHSSYCLFCALLSPGHNRADCGSPCREHDVRLRDRLGVEHPLMTDSQCRNTLFHAEAESLVASVPKLTARGIRHFRLESLGKEDFRELPRVLAAVRTSLDER